MGNVENIPINRYLGIKYHESSQNLSLPDNLNIHNYFGDISFCAQFTLAEAASAQYLFDKLGMKLSKEMPTLRNAKIKFHKPTKGESLCNLISLQHTFDEFQNILHRRGKILTRIDVEVVSETKVKALECSFVWLIIRYKK